ncbi:MAG: guanine deaminase [Planctomycetota bacterium]
MTTEYHATVLQSIAPSRVELHAPGALEVGADGRILRAGAPRQRNRGATIVDLVDRLVIPGLVDAHLHIPQIDLPGLGAATLLDWLDRYVFPAELEQSEPEIARDRARRCFANLLAHGTTACAAYSSMHTRATEIALEEAERAGIRAVVGKVLMDREAPAELLEAPSSALADTARLIRDWSGRGNGRLAVAITPRFAVSCSAALLSGAGALAKSTGARVQTHLAESVGELAAVQRLFPDAGDYTRVYEDAGLARAGALFAHCIHVSDAELGRLAQANAALVHCPDSNFFLHSGRFPLARARARGVEIALGTDVGAGTCLSLFETMKLGAYAQSEPVDPLLLFYLATLGGARALGWGSEIGNFAAGKAADFVVLDPTALLGRRPLAEWDARELISVLMHRNRELKVEAVYVAGHRLP